jgi:hypothetical protein
MTEERIIDYAIIERTFDKAGDAKAQWLMIKAISEPAPPKDWKERLHNVMPPTDWRPMCYDSQYNKLNGCDPINPIVRTCQQCPFLAARHKTKITQKSGGLDINLDINEVRK